MLVVILSIGIITLWLTVRAAEGLARSDLEVAGAFLAGGVLVWTALHGGGDDDKE